jgi:hypothetical protein
VEEGFEKVAALRSSRRELRFQPIAQRHELVHPGDDAPLLGERWKRNEKRLYTADPEVLHCRTHRLVLNALK